jgi:hypothetical protein
MEWRANSGGTSSLESSSIAPSLKAAELVSAVIRDFSLQRKY